MSRLTMKLDEPIKTKYLNYEYNRIPDYDIVRGNFGRISDDMIFNKLGRLEDLEDELDCPLDVVFNALKQGCYIQDEGYFECPDIYFHSLEMEFVIGWANKDNMGYELLKDYKKTWFLKGDLSE